MKELKLKQDVVFALWELDDIISDRRKGLLEADGSRLDDEGYIWIMQGSEAAHLMARYLRDNNMRRIDHLLRLTDEQQRDQYNPNKHKRYLSQVYSMLCDVQQAICEGSDIRNGEYARYYDSRCFM